MEQARRIVSGHRRRHSENCLRQSVFVVVAVVLRHGRYSSQYYCQYALLSDLRGSQCVFFRGESKARAGSTPLITLVRASIGGRSCSGICLANWRPPGAGRCPWNGGRARLFTSCDVAGVSRRRSMTFIREGWPCESRYSGSHHLDDRMRAGADTAHATVGLSDHADVALCLRDGRSQSLQLGVVAQSSLFSIFQRLPAGRLQSSLVVVQSHQSLLYRYRVSVLSCD